MKKNKALDGIVMVKKNGKIIYFDLEQIAQVTNKNKKDEPYKG